MNKGMFKLTALAALSTAFGIVLTVNSANADDTSDAVTSANSTTEQVVTSYSQSKQALDQITVPTASAAQQNSESAVPVRNTSNAQQINYPVNYNLDQLRNVSQSNPASVDNFDQVAKPGLAKNNYQSDPASANQQVNVTNLNDQQTTEINNYALDLVNQARAHFGEGPFIQNQGSVNTVKGMALQYQNKKKSLLNEPRSEWHDQSILNGDSENVTAMEIYADNDPRLNSVVRPFATARGIDFVNDRLPLFSITNMDDLRAMVFYGVTMMLFKDKGDYYSHAQNFLTANQPIMAMAVYPSVIDGLESAQVRGGHNFPYRVHVVDMHYIWASGLNSVIGYFGKPDSFVNYNHHVYYYGHDGRLYQNRFYQNWGKTYYFGSDGARWDNQWYRNWGHSYYFKNDGSRATSEIAKIGNDYYYFDNQGIMKTNAFRTQNGKVYYFDNDGRAYRDRFYQNWGHMYYFGNNGARYTNQFYTNWGHTYYFGNDGARWDNRWMNAWGHSYYFKGDGARATSEVVKIGNDYYYFDNQGIMKTNYFLNQGGKVYYFGNDGKEYRNRFYQNWGHMYYFGNDGARWDNRWMNAWGHRYYFKWDGSRATSEYFPVNGETYYFDDQGIAHDDPLVTQWLPWA